MSCDLIHKGWDELHERLRLAPVLTPDLLSETIRQTCICFDVMETAGQMAHLERLIDDRAWCDAVLTLAEIELPGWKLRRLSCDDGEWFCSFSQNPSTPVELDDTADAHHPVLALALLSAFVEACRMRAARSEPRRQLGVPKVAAKLTSCRALCCDNYA